MTDDLFASGGETGRLMGALDWSRTDLGPVAGWPQSLRAAVRIVLSSRYPMLLLWGPRFTQLYNDAYSALIGDRHPAALGHDVRITLAEGWDVLAPLINDAMATGVASWVPALRLLLNRSGYREEAYFSVSHAPARDDDGVTVGVLTVCSEVTDQVVGERRLRLLREVSVPAGTALDDVGQTCARLCDVIGEHPLDVPFAAVYLRDGAILRRVAATAATPPALPAEIHDQDHWGVRAAAATGTVQVTPAGGRIAVPAGPWDDPVEVTLAQPLPSAGPGEPVGVLLAGVSPSRALDETYRSFFALLGQQVAVAVRTARAYQEERARAAALAELDRVKTDFFTNVSHEFRTPLTLMLGPLADALADETAPLDPVQRERVDTAWRNAGRMLGLVNDLLTFSSVEAGRARATPAGVDLPAFTRELAAVFRAAIERAGLRLVVDCPPLPRPVAVDPEHWERIVTNLLSNALKFTFVGEIRVTLRAGADAVHLSVADTGIGVDPAELPHLFDRFHRVHGARSRSHEGTGIGLALVRELTRLQGGDVTVDSAPGEGTTFTVTLPWSAIDATGVPDAPATDPMTTARAAVREATGWLDDHPADTHLPGPAAEILVVDDNADMRAYLTRLLTAQGWSVRTAGDGEAALRSILADPPDLVITDVMMPRSDGFALVRALRQEEATRRLPIVMLSARAGGESGAEGLDAGADDYIVKPFTAADLIARVRTGLRLSRADEHAPAVQPPAAQPAPAAADAPPSAEPRGAAESPVATTSPSPAEPRGAAGPPSSAELPASPESTVPAGAAPVAEGLEAAGSGGRHRAGREPDLPEVDVVWTYPLEPSAAAAVRRDLRAMLPDDKIDPDLLYDLQIATTEAVNNAVEHTQAPSRPHVEVRLRARDGLIRIEVQDFGTWRARPPALDRGRGAVLMNAFGDVRVTPSPTGTLVTIERRWIT
ncbi:ATP-binding protein [Catenuloplanes atrovinosus]|uniref:histidine kinase n=1 Tax=Catenuloplanes atrovinosus TaxID=137266 RepID=A0AAE3YM73_9ACTN|nr:ATP-binding protein [Catenuloplanes atrovinosus]MDR7276364.1 signal transduction histidine kinase/CheY-like chemotaxis protein [Catenuloplanes atrovinosus]